MSICEQKIQHNSVPAELKPLSDADQLPFLSVLCSLKQNVHNIMLEKKIINSSRGAQNIGSRSPEGLHFVRQCLDIFGSSVWKILHVT